MGDSGTTTTTGTTGPSNPKVTETINQLLGGVQDAWKTGPKTFGESLYGGVGNTTRQGWNSTLNAARNPAFQTGMNGAMNYTSGLIGNGGLTGNRSAPAYRPAGNGGVMVGEYRGDYPRTGGTMITPPPDGTGGTMITPPAAAGGTSIDPTGTYKPTDPGYYKSTTLPTTKTTSIDPPTKPIDPTKPADDTYLRPPPYNDPGQSQQTQFADPLSGYGQGGGDTGGGQWGDLNTTRGIGQQYGQLGNAFTAGTPGMDRLRGNLQNDTLAGVNSMFGGSGRLGSGLHSQKATEGLGNALAAFDYGNYQNDINNRYRSLDSQAGQANAAFGMEQQGINNQMGLGSSLSGLYQSSLLPGQTYGMIGAQQDADTQAQLLGRNDLFRRTNDAKTDWLAKLSGILGVNAGAGGQTMSQTEPNAPWWQQVLGAGAIGSGIYGNIFK